MDLSRLLADATKFAHMFGVGSSLKTYLRKFFIPLLKNLAGETSNFVDLPQTRRQSEARNFQTAQLIDKQQEGQNPLTGQRAANYRLLANQ